MRIISSIRTAALVVAPAVPACSQRVEPRPPPSQDHTTMKAFGPDARPPIIDMDMQEAFDEAVRVRRSYPNMEVRVAELMYAWRVTGRHVTGRHVVPVERSPRSTPDAVHSGADLARRQS